MSDEGRYSRRELLRGRFLAGLLGAAADEVSKRFGDDEDDRASTGDAKDRPPGHPPSAPVMRYPKSGEDVARVNAPCSPPMSAGASPAGRRRRGAVPVLRPPGAIDEATFLQECTRCFDCAEACPHDAIIEAPARFRDAAGTPMIDPDRQPCHMCADFPCIASCEPDVLSELASKTMGTARIIEQTCTAHQGGFCTVCSEQCPVDGAIEVENGRPRVVEDTCTGCGVCRYVCPAPSNAVLLMPAFTRPARAGREDCDE